jgi:hypothetical protein
MTKSQPSLTYLAKSQPNLNLVKLTTYVRQLKIGGLD